MSAHDEDLAHRSAAVRMSRLVSYGGSLVNGHFLRKLGRSRTNFTRSLLHDVHTVTDDEIYLLLGSGNWAAQIAGSWFAALSRRTHFREYIGELLLASRLPYAGEGHCAALALFGTGRDADMISAYLARWLPLVERRYDQDWALGALLYLDAEFSTDRSSEFLGEDGPWSRWVGKIPWLPADPAYYQRRCEQLCGYAHAAMREYPPADTGQGVPQRAREIVAPPEDPRPV